MGFLTDKLEPGKGQPPPVAISEAIIDRMAPFAVDVLRQNNAEDLYEMLGLSNHVGVNND